MDKRNSVIAENVFLFILWKNKDVIMWILSIHATAALQVLRRETFVQ